MRLSSHPRTWIVSMIALNIACLFVEAADNSSEPTIIPSTAPSILPTFVPSNTPIPSSAPSQTSGWVTFNSFNQQGTCDGTITKTIGFPTNTCLIERTIPFQKLNNSLIYSCTADTASVTYFNDSACSHHNFVESTTYSLNICNTTTDTSTDLYSAITYCTETASISDLPAPFNDGTHIIRNTFDSLSGCIEGTQSSFEAIIQNYCFPDDIISPSHKYLSYKYIYPYKMTYYKTDCVGTPTYTLLSTECSDSGSGVNDDFVFSDTMQYTVWTNGVSEYTYPPTQQPDTASVTYFNDSACSHHNFVESTTYSLNICNTTTDTSTDLYSAITYCTETASISDLPAPFDDGTHIIRNTFDSLSGCIEGTQSSFEAIVQNYCFPDDIISPSHKYLSYKYIYPYKMTYYKADCVGTPTYTLLSTECSDSGSSANDDFVFSDTMQYTVWTNGVSEYTYPPTQQPGTPTKYPTFVTTSWIQFQVNQTLQGISAAEFKSDYVANNQSFAFTAADIMTGLTPTDIKVTNVQDNNWEDTTDIMNRKLQSSSDSAASSVATRKLQSSTNECNITYLVYFNTFGAGYTSAGNAFDTMTEQLTTAVNNGVFTYYLHYYAQLFNATLLYEVNSTSVSVATAYVTVVQTAADDDDGPTAEEEKELIAGLTVAFIVILACILCFLRRSCSRNNPPELEGPLVDYMPHYATATVVHTDVTTVNALQMRNSDSTNASRNNSTASGASASVPAVKRGSVPVHVTGFEV